jgi:hypothetical protein
MKGSRTLSLAAFGLAAALAWDACAQDGKQQAAAVFQAPRLALDKGATACVGLLQDALRLTVDGDHQELSSWHPVDTRSRTFWTAQVDHAGNRGAFVGVTPTEGARCDGQTVRVSYLKQDCKAAIAELGKGGSSPVSMSSATVIQRDATGRLTMFLPGGAGCVFVEMAVLYGR